MRKYTIALIAVAGILATSMAGAQDKMEKMGKMDKMQGKMSGKMTKSKTHDTMMMGLTMEERKLAMAHMARMTDAEKAVMMKKGMMCMKEDHSGMSGMKMEEKAGMAHMMKGLTLKEKETMKMMWSKMSMREKAVSKKMMMNCCMNGMKPGM